MVKVTQPLGSTSAHGAVGKFVIFQGNTAKSYAAPVINKTLVQLDNQDRFESVTKTLRACKLFMRGQLSAMLGPDWYSGMYGEVCKYWDTSAAFFSTWEDVYKIAWRDNAPAQDIRLDCGLVFYACAQAILELSIIKQYEVYQIPVPEMGTSAAIRGKWDKGIDHVFYSGMYDSTNADLDIFIDPSFWTVVNDVNALGGSYVRSAVSSPTNGSLQFYGTKFGLLYHQAVLQGLCAVDVDIYNHYSFSQNNSSGLWQVEWVSPLFNRGIHDVSFSRTGAAGAINIDGIVIYG